MALSAALACASGGTPAQQPVEEGQVPVRVFVTGSNIPSTASERALPVQVITREEIEALHLSTASELVATISSAMSFGAFNEVRGVGTDGQAGFAGAGLRGLGHQATLVLVNGRRLPNFPLTTIGVSLNTIPLSAVSRVEVLPSGASAIYGSDAVAGVINFILRDTFTGVEAFASYSGAEHAGGDLRQATLTAGHGELAADGFNAWLMVDYQDRDAILARDRSFASRAWIPGTGLDRTSPISLPANVLTPLGLRNPSGSPGNGYLSPACMPSLSFPIPEGAKAWQCRWNGDGATSIVNGSERTYLVGALTAQWERTYQFYATASYSRNRLDFQSDPSPVSAFSATTFDRFLLPPASPWYPHGFAGAMGLAGLPLDVQWRAQDLGPRTATALSTQTSIIAGLRGAWEGWRYDTALNYGRNVAEQDLTGGYLLASKVFPIVNSGVVNPFGENGAGVIDLLQSAEFRGRLVRGTSSIAAVDFKASNAIAELPAGPLLLAVGTDVRRERLDYDVDPAYANGDIVDLGVDRPFSASRHVYAVFAEANVPLARGFEADFAVRYDYYSDFGGTTNPNLALRWQPMSTLLLRASTGTGYFAPSLFGLHGAQVHGITPLLSDPARCPTVQQDCERSFPNLLGGNPDLQPVTSYQWSVGGVWQALPELSISADFVSILLDDRIAFYTAGTILGQCPDGIHGATCHLVDRAPPDAQWPGLPGEILLIDQTLTNFGKQKVMAVDVGVRYRTAPQPWGRAGVSLNGTYTIENVRQNQDGSYTNLVNHYSALGGNPGVIPHWRHLLVLDWQQGPWTVTLDQTFQTGGDDEPLVTDDGAVLNRKIGSYAVWGLRIAYSGWKQWTLAAGVGNLFDRDPPYSNQTQSVQIGYDPTYTDPTGRTFWASVRYRF